MAPPVHFQKPATAAPSAQPQVTVKAAPQARHPELGRLLPGSGARPRRPEVDYLVPTRKSVPGVLPEPRPAAATKPDPSHTTQPTSSRSAASLRPVAPVIKLDPPADLRPVHVRVPRVGLDTTVVEVFLQDGVWQVADYAAGYLHGTGLPGLGNVVMAGHKGRRGAVFARLESLKVGDEVLVFGFWSTPWTGASGIGFARHAVSGHPRSTSCFRHLHLP